MSLSFNPRARAGRDAVEYIGVDQFAVSIHAPARGATGWWMIFNATQARFNPRARAGRDLSGSMS